jgi:uncharacterized protein (DUF4415 family)
MSEKQKYIHSNLAKLDTKHDKDIDYTDIPATSEDFWQDAQIQHPTKQKVTLRLDRDVLAFFKAKGKGYTTAMNDILRHYMQVAQKQTVKAQR